MSITLQFTFKSRAPDKCALEEASWFDYDLTLLDIHGKGVS
jgi:hypothetical protein